MCDSLNIQQLQIAKNMYGNILQCISNLFILTQPHDGGSKIPWNYGVILTD